MADLWEIRSRLALDFYYSDLQMCSESLAQRYSYRLFSPLLILLPNSCFSPQTPFLLSLWFRVELAGQLQQRPYPFWKPGPSLQK